MLVDGDTTRDRPTSAMHAVLQQDGTGSCALSTAQKWRPAKWFVTHNIKIPLQHTSCDKVPANTEHTGTTGAAAAVHPPF